MPSRAGKASQVAGLAASLAVIGILWAVTPLSYIYVTWTVAGAFKDGLLPSDGTLTLRHTLHFVILAYTLFAEIPFSLYYRYLALRANARWPGHERVDAEQVRRIFRKCLESGLGMSEVAGEDPLSSLVMGQVPGENLEEEAGGLRRRLPMPPTPAVECRLDEDDPRAVDFRNHLVGWFGHCRFEDIRRDNLLSWLAWSIYGQPIEELILDTKAPDRRGPDGEPGSSSKESREEKLAFVERGLKLVEARVGRQFPPGNNSRIRVVRLTLDPVKVASRPLLLYLFVFGMQERAKARARGFTEHEDGDTRYLLRIPADWKPDEVDESARPLLFVHGLGMGIAQYSTFLDHLATSPELNRRPLMVLLQPHISMSFFHRQYLRPPTQESCVRDLRRMSARWGFDRSGITVLSHSNGSIVHGWLVKSAPELVRRSCFVDPVCFCLWEGSVCINFLYKRAKTPFDFLMRYFVSTELGIALVMQRSFSWSSNLLFPSQIPCLDSKEKVAFFLAAEDVILDAGRVRSYLLSHGVEESSRAGQGGVFIQPGQKHGGDLVQRGVMKWVTGATNVNA